MNITKSLVVAAVAAFATPIIATAAVPSSAIQNVPGKMNYQGYLADPSTGKAYSDGIYTLNIRIWNATSGGTCLWGGKYSVYVKDGYFNIMLGDSAATALTAADGTTPSYPNADLWKALWGDTTTDSNRYLGVTPLQGPTGNTLTNPTEITPRQQLLTSPFAFRAQHAQYADQSQGGFTVAGSLTVAGSTTFNGTINATTSGTQSFGPMKTTKSSSSSYVYLGNGQTAASSSTLSSLPDAVYDVAKSLYFYAYNNMDFKSTAGNMTFNIPSSGKYMKVTGSGDFISEAYNNTLSSSGSTKISGSGASSINLNGTGYMQLKTTANNLNLESGATGTTTIKGGAMNVMSTSNSVMITSTKPVYLKGPYATSTWGVIGQGDVAWAFRATSSGSSSYSYPVKNYRVKITIPANSWYKTYDLASLLGSNSGDFFWTIAGFDYNSVNESLSKCCMSGTTLYIATESTSSNARTFMVYIQGVSKCFSGPNLNDITVP